MTSFKCPECGATEVASNLCVSTDWSTGGEATSPCHMCFNNYFVNNVIAIFLLI